MQPTRHEELLASASHIGATAEQRKHFELAAMDRSLYSKLNNGEPGVAATRRAGVLDGAGITRSKSGDEVATGPNAKSVGATNIERSRAKQPP